MFPFLLYSSAFFPFLRFSLLPFLSFVPLVFIAVSFPFVRFSFYAAFSSLFLSFPPFILRVCLLREQSDDSSSNAAWVCLIVVFALAFWFYYRFFGPSAVIFFWRKKPSNWEYVKSAIFGGDNGSGEFFQRKYRHKINHQPETFILKSLFSSDCTDHHHPHHHPLFLSRRCSWWLDKCKILLSW